MHVCKNYACLYVSIDLNTLLHVCKTMHYMPACVSAKLHVCMSVCMVIMLCVCFLMYVCLCVCVCVCIDISACLCGWVFHFICIFSSGLTLCIILYHHIKLGDTMSLIVSRRLMFVAI